MRAAASAADFGRCLESFSTAKLCCRCNQVLHKPGVPRQGKLKVAREPVQRLHTAVEVEHYDDRLTAGPLALRNTLAKPPGAV